MTLMDEGAGDCETTMGNDINDISETNETGTTSATASTAATSLTANDPQDTDASSVELAWAHDLFDNTRGEAEPPWAVDLAVITKAGHRRRRFRRARTGGGVLAVLAVTTAAAVTLGAGTTDYGSSAGPAGGWGARPLQDVFRYVEVNGGSFPGNNGDLYHHVPKSAAVDAAVLVGHLDPAGTHLRGEPDRPDGPNPRIVGDGDAWVKGAANIEMSSDWSADGTGPTSAQVSYGFFDDVNTLRTGIAGRPVSGPCGLNMELFLGVIDPTGTTPLPQWSGCRYTTLADGSRVAAASASVGAGTETVAVRIFGSGNVIGMLGTNYQWTAAVDGARPSARAVVTPSPWSEDGFRAALSDTALVPVLHPRGPVNADGKLLVPSDIGSDWAYDPTGGSEGTGEFVLDNGCTPDHSIFGLASGRAVGYTGTLPDGTAGTGFEGEYRLPAGTGARTMQDAQKYGQGGCGGFSQDTVAALPSGIGDSAFLLYQPQQSTVRVTVRLGDTILQTDIGRADHSPLTLTSAADRTWLQQIAQRMVAHYTGVAGRG
ncbi:hypothetical protein Caci_0282 [Catenulispora acidiphila DSM 44928]|uniref:Uncharacterized protein n=1 Tax=Catenulispora acidiphila (strain DSM 44928 / JCM 14897 / NBRC 102108 / NRRL B-24433 / ID139908) TaxID=479433 RepID=C7QJ93_CATAD|nr:hypothetical protein [Catenulispora acidiphila]ACU69235.1 hypothetical protein Caci_0282 [Catenulispora acidiphila DSM 44928]